MSFKMLRYGALSPVGFDDIKTAFGFLSKAVTLIKCHYISRILVALPIAGVIVHF